MILKNSHHNETLRKRLDRLSVSDNDYWSFRYNARREHSHSFFQYPAMMVPQMVRSVLNEVCLVHPEIKWVYDPFVGSGTILTESMLKGLNFVGQDINPLAILLCQTKLGPFKSNTIEQKANELIRQIYQDRKTKIDVNFPNIDKWFNKNTQISLSKIRRAIQKEPQKWVRRFFWICLAGTIRVTSNSRTSTFKLHIRSSEDLISRQIDPILIFSKIVERNSKNFKLQTDFLSDKGFLQHGRYLGKINIVLQDSRKEINFIKNKSDLIITSPPYGDNQTTVPYGQFSYLPLQWINLKDIDKSIDAEYLSTTSTIDTKSLGGSKALKNNDLEFLCDTSSSFKKLLERLNKVTPKGSQKVAAFFRDLNNCLEPILGSLRKNGLMVWTLGNRRVGGLQVPLNEILSDLFSKHKIEHVTSIDRKIPYKRMPRKNKTTDTMSTETILVMRKRS